jgi:hypothetical protein
MDTENSGSNAQVEAVAAAAAVEVEPKTTTEAEKPVPAPKPETLADNPGKWAKPGCSKCNGRGIMGRLLVKGVPRIPVFCRCARLAYHKAQAQKPGSSENNDVTSLIALQAAATQAMDRSDTLIERAKSDLDRGDELRRQLQELMEPNTELCGIADAQAEKEMVLAGRSVFDDELGKIFSDIGDCSQAITGYQAEIAQLQNLISLREQSRRQLEILVDQTFKDKAELTNEPLEEVEKKLELAETSRGRRAHSLRKKIREAEERSDKLLNRAAKVRREAGIELGDGLGEGND